MRTVTSFVLAVVICACASVDVFAAGLTWTKKSYVLSKPPAGFSVKFDYPYFVGPDSGLVNGALQAELAKQAKADAKDYSDFVSDDLPICKEAKKHKDGSSIQASFTVHKTTDNIVSVSFATCSFYYGQAHPVNNYFVFNYSLATKTAITMTSLTQEQDKFLKLVSKDCARQITKLLKYPDKQIIADGTMPTYDNFKNFVLLDKAIGFYFDDAQASVHAEPIEKPILIPYSQLKGVLSPTSPVSRL